MNKYTSLSTFWGATMHCVFHSELLIKITCNASSIDEVNFSCTSVPFSLVGSFVAVSLSLSTVSKFGN